MTPIRPNSLRLLIASLASATSLVAGTSTPPASATTNVTIEPEQAGNPHPCMCLGAHSGGEGSSLLSGNITLAYDSTFFCRGMDMGDDMASATLNVDLRLADNLTWATSARYLSVDETSFEELHLYTGLFARFGAVSFGPSFRWYRNFQGGMMENAYDLGFQGIVNLGPIDLDAGYYYETESEGHFFEVGLSSKIKVADKLTIIPAVQVGYTDGWMMPIQGWNQVSLRLGARYDITSTVAISPWIGANLPLEALDAGQDDKLVGGVSVSVSF